MMHGSFKLFARYGCLSATRSATACPLYQRVHYVCSTLRATLYRFAKPVSALWTYAIHSVVMPDLAKRLRALASAAHLRSSSVAGLVRTFSFVFVPGGAS